MYPVEDSIVYKVENTIPANRGISTGIICPQVPYKHTVLTTQGATKSVVPGVETLREDRVLNGNIYGAEFLLGFTCAVIIHMPVHRHIFIQSPACRHMVNDDVPDRITANGIIPAAHIGFAATETHVPDDDVMCIDPN